MLERIHLKSDLCVIGGGIAGVCTAISAAREGIKVILVHERPVLGGNASSEIRMWICGAQGDNMRESGIMEEIHLNNFYYNPTKNHYIFDNILLNIVKNEKNITLLLNCTCMDAKVTKACYEFGRDINIDMISAYQMTTQCFYDIHSKFYADCSGDSILAPLTGADFVCGRESSDDYGEKTHVKTPDKLTMGNSCLIQARQTARKVPHITQENALKLTDEDFKYRNPDIYNTDENFWYLELGGNMDTIGDSEEIADKLKSLAFGVWNYLKSNPKYRADNFDLEFMGALPGKRESRRYVGEYMIKQQDISEGKVFSDTVAYGGWPIDDHFPDGFYHRNFPNTNIKTCAPYPVPYRILYSANVNNLFFAGRNISSTHTALSSLRVMASCGIMGEAVGTAASLAVKYNTSPHGVYENHIFKMQNILMDKDCFLPHFKREISPLCISTPICGGEALKNGEDRANPIYNSTKCGITAENNSCIEYKFKNATYIKSVHVVFDSDFNRNTLPGSTAEREHATRCNILLDSPDIYMPKTLCREYELTFTYKDGSKKINKTKNNKQRYLHINTDDYLTAISLKPISNWGGSDRTNIFSFDFK